MMYIYFNLSEGKLYANPILDAFESISSNSSKSIFKCKMFALKHSMVSLNDETRKLKSVLTSLENQNSKSQSQINTVREIIMKRNKTLEMCEKQIKEINREATNIRNGMKGIVGSKNAAKRYPESKKCFTSSQIKNFEIMEYLESNFERCSENTKQIVEKKRQIEHHKYLENPLNVKRKEKLKKHNNNQCAGKIRQGRVCKKRKMEDIRGLHEDKTNASKCRSFLYSATFISLNEYTVRSKERKVSVPLNNTSTNIKNKLKRIQLNMDQTKYTLPTETKIKRQQPSTYSSAHILNNQVPMIKVNIIFKKSLQKKYFRITKSESEIIYSQGSQLLEDTSFRLTVSTKSEPKMSLQSDTLSIEDREDDVKIIYDSYYSQNFKECLKSNRVIEELKKKDLVALKETEETKSDIKMEQIFGELDEKDLEQVYSNNIMKRKLYKRLRMQIRATAQLKVLLNYKFESTISLITKNMLENTVNITKKGLTERENQEINSDKVNDGTIERYLASSDQKTIHLKKFASNTINTKAPIELRLSKSMQEIIFPKIQLQPFSMRNYSQLQYKLLLPHQNTRGESAGSGNQEQNLFCRENASILEPDSGENLRVQLVINGGDSSDQTNSKPIRSINIHVETQTPSPAENHKAIPETREQSTGTNLIKSLRNQSVHISEKKTPEPTQYKKLGSANTVIRKKILTKEVPRTQGPSIFNKKRPKDVKLCEKSGLVLPKREKKVVEQRCKIVNNNRTTQNKVKKMKSIEKEDQLNDNKKKNINNNSLGSKSIPELDRIECDLRKVVQQITKLELEKFFKNQTDTVTSIEMEEAATDTDSKLECEMNTIIEEINENENKGQSLELLPVSDEINDEAIFNMIQSLENLQAGLSKCRTNKNIQFPIEHLEQLFTVFIELMIKLNEFRKSNSGVDKKVVSTSEDVSLNVCTTQESVPTVYKEIESEMDEYSEILEEINTDGQQILIQTITSMEETQFLDENDSKKEDIYGEDIIEEDINEEDINEEDINEEDINEEQIIIAQKQWSKTSQIYEVNCRSDGSSEESENTDFVTPPKRVRFDQNTSLEIKSPSRNLKADRLKMNQEKVDCGVLVKPNTKRNYHASKSITKSKVDFGTSFDLNKKYISRSKTCTCNCMKSQNRGNFGIITELMRSMDKTHHVDKFNLKARDFQNNYDQYRICHTVTNLMRGLGDEQKVTGPTTKNCTGRCQKVTNDSEFQSAGRGKNYYDSAVVDLRKNNPGHELIYNLKQFNSRRQSAFEDLLPFGKRFVLTPRRSYY